MYIEDNIKNDLEFCIRQEFCNRPDLGIAAFSTENGALNCESNVFSYENCIATASLIQQGYDEIDAAALVAHRLVYASPHFPGRGIDGPDSADPVGLRGVGIYRLADGSLWSVFADNDIGCISPGELSRDYLVVATRALSIVDEVPADRVRHLLTCCDEFGHYLAAA